MDTTTCISTWTPLLVKTFAAQWLIQLDIDDTLSHRWGRKVCGAGRQKGKRGRPRTKCHQLSVLEHMPGPRCGVICGANEQKPCSASRSDMTKTSWSS